MVNKKLQILLYFSIYSLLGIMLGGHVVFADETTDLAQVVSIQTIGDSNNTEALNRLLALKQTQTSSTPIRVRLETLKVLADLYYDASQITSSTATVHELLSLATAEKDATGIAIAEIMSVNQLIDSGKPQEGLNKLQAISENLPSDAAIEVRMRLEHAFGFVNHLLGNFDTSLRYMLEALKLSDDLPTRKVQNRLIMLDAIARVYISMKDPAKALSTVVDALDISPLAQAPKILASLSNSQGVAYSLLGQHDKSIEAYKRALKISHDTGMATNEMSCLINISDHYLILNQYKQAETYARQALERAERVADKSTIDIARVNLGFALVGLGKMSQGVELVNAAIHDLMESGQKTDAEDIIAELANAYERAGMFKEALATLRQQQQLNSELFSAERSKAVATLQEQFNAKQKQKQIELLAKDNALKDAHIRNHRLQQAIILLGATVTVMVGMFIFLLYRRGQRVNKQLREANAQLEFHAVHDPLTGLYNRRSFVERMHLRTAEIEAERREVRDGNPDCLILLDTDHFKQINDTWGHAAGDTVLADVAQRLRKTVRDTDMLLRWGGEEFLVYAPKSNPDQIAILVERLLQSVGGTGIAIGEHQIQVTMTAGFISLPFSGFPEDQFNWEKAIHIADMALYLGKRNGRNRAYGVARVLVDAASAVPFFEDDLAAAVSAGIVELTEVMGPPKIDFSHAM